jgi:hypothetical protein
MHYQRDFATWDELEGHIREMAESNAVAGGLGLGYYSHLLFRGQASYGWPLETTLERARPKSTELSEYYRAVAIAKTQIETFTNRTWGEIDYQKTVDLLQSYDALRFSNLPSYDFLVYLRHHGFPSPLLDWSRSLYVAAFFAFNAPKAERVALFVYQEHGGSGKVSSSGEAQIMVLGPNVRSHPRHFLQQGEYTLCCQYTAGSWHFAPHSNVFAKGEESQDRLWKLTLPASESSRVMKRLDEYNINAFSLFQSEESLMASLAARVFPGR